MPEYQPNLASPPDLALYHRNSTTPGDNYTAYDPLGRITAVQMGTLGSSGNNGTSLDTVTTVNPNPSASNQSFSFDAVGNVTSETVVSGGSPVSNSFNAQNEETAAGSTALSYDNNGNWNGVPTASTGVITSIPAAQNGAQTTGIGYADSADGLIVGQDANTIELKYTLYGDTGLSTTVGFNEFTRLTQHYNQMTGGTWDTGDFNYDGSVNFTDFTLLTRTYNTTLGSQAGSASSPQAAPAGSSSPQTSSATVAVAQIHRHRRSMIHHLFRADRKRRG